MGRAERGAFPEEVVALPVSSRSSASDAGNRRGP